MTARFIASIVVVSSLVMCCPSQAQQVWDPAKAVSDAEREIARQNVKFCYVGGIASHAPGLPPKGFAVARDYPKIEVGPQGCTQKEADFKINSEYATRYNTRMWDFLMSRPDLWK